MTNKEPLRLTFGVEGECVLAYPAGIFGTGLKDVKMRREVEECMDRSGIPTNELRGDDPIIYEKWTINEDTTIQKPPNTAEEEYEDMEIITRVLYYDDPSSFKEIREVLELIKSNFKVVMGVQNSCGLHVHIGNEDRGFDIEGLRRYALLVVAFEHLLLSLIPLYRTDPQLSFKCFCYPPSRLPDFENLTLQERLDKIRTCEREWQLQELMNPIWHGKNLAFNLSSHSDGSKRTIEHRMFPGTTDVDEILANVELCASLISFAWNFSNAEVDVLLESAFDASFELKHLLSSFGKPELWSVLHDNARRRTDWGVQLPPTRQASPSTPAGSSTATSPISPRSFDSGISIEDAWDIFISGGAEARWQDDGGIWTMPTAYKIDAEKLFDISSQGFEEYDGWVSKAKDVWTGENSVLIDEDFEGLSGLFGEDT